MRAFVTGGSGFLGRNLIARLRARGDEVVALARSDAAAKQVTQAGAAVVARGDLDAVEPLVAGMRGCDVVFHCAAIAADWGTESAFMAANVTGTEHVLAAAARAGVRRVVHVSTEAVLVGGRAIVQADESWPRPARPIGLYPRTKGLAEERVLAAKGVDAVIVRPRFIWGAGDTSVLPKVEAAVRAGSFRWIGGGTYLTSTCHVDNVVEGMLLAAERGKPGAIYFLTDGDPVELRGFMTRLLATRGVDPGARSIPRWLARASAAAVEMAWRAFRIDRDPPVTRTAVRLIGEEVTVSDRRARDELGYRPVTSIDAGLAAMTPGG